LPEAGGTRLGQAEVIDDDFGVRVSVRQLAQSIELIPTEHIDGQVVLRAGRQDAGDSRACGVVRHLRAQHDAGADGSGCGCPDVELCVEVSAARIEGTDQAESGRMVRMDLDGVAGVVPIDTPG